MQRTASQIAGEVFFKTAGLAEHFPKTLGHLQTLKETLGKKFEERFFKTLEEKAQGVSSRSEKEQKLLRHIGKDKTADERIGGPYLRYDTEKSNKAIGMPPEEQLSPAFSRPEPPRQSGYDMSDVSLPRYQFEVSEQPTMAQTKMLPSAKESVASIIDKIAEAVDEMNGFVPQAAPTSGSFVPPLVGGLMGAPLGWYAGNEYGMNKLPGYHALDKVFNAITSCRGLLANEPALQNAADIAGGTLWGKKEILKMFGPIGAYRLGGAALGLGGGLLAGALINKAMA
jgi:hypothetical protein